MNSLLKLHKSFERAAKKQHSPWKYFDWQGNISAKLLSEILNNPEQKAEMLQELKQIVAQQR